MKPHIKMVNGWWRVSPMPKPYHRHQELWVRVHRLVTEKNSEVKHR